MRTTWSLVWNNTNRFTVFHCVESREKMNHLTTFSPHKSMPVPVIYSSGIAVTTQKTSQNLSCSWHSVHQVDAIFASCILSTKHLIFLLCLAAKSHKKINHRERHYGLCVVCGPYTHGSNGRKYKSIFSTAWWKKLLFTSFLLASLKLN